MARFSPIPDEVFGWPVIITVRRPVLRHDPAERLSVLCVMPGDTPYRYAVIDLRRSEERWVISRQRGRLTYPSALTRLRLHDVAGLPRRRPDGFGIPPQRRDSDDGQQEEPDHD